MVRTNLLDQILTNMQGGGAQERRISVGDSSVLAIRHLKKTSFEFQTYQPVICLILQGEKELVCANEPFRARAGQMVVISHDIHVLARIKSATPQKPYAALIIPIDLLKLRDIRLNNGREPDNRSGSSALSVGDSPAELENAAARYLSLHDRPLEAEILAPHVLHEIYFRGLISDSGGMLRELLIRDSHADRIHRAVQYIRGNYQSRITIGGLAREVGMSNSSFHSHFRRITNTTPLKMQRDLRLMEVRDRLRLSRETLSTLADDVGYATLAQLSRQYKKKFGRSPLKDRNESLQRSEIDR